MTSPVTPATPGVPVSAARTGDGVALGETEVEDLDRACGRHFDVRGLEIAVNDAPFMSGIQRIGDLTGERERSRHRKRAAHNPVRQCLSVHQFHHQGRHALGIFDAVDGGDMRVADRGEDARLALETLHTIRV